MDRSPEFYVGLYPSLLNSSSSYFPVFLHLLPCHLICLRKVIKDLRVEEEKESFKTTQAR